jgi:hypothetical protein
MVVAGGKGIRYQGMGNGGRLELRAASIPPATAAITMQIEKKSTKLKYLTVPDSVN